MHWNRKVEIHTGEWKMHRRAEKYGTGDPEIE